MPTSLTLQPGCGEGLSQFSRLGCYSHAGIMRRGPMPHLTFSGSSFGLYLMDNLGSLRPGPSVGFPFGGCFWTYWQWWGGSCHHCGHLELSPGDLRLVSPLGGEGAGEWGVYPLTSPLPPPLAELCSPGRQAVNLETLWLIPAMG